MRLTKGDNVEVMSKHDELLSWHPARILSCNGHIYRVQYYSHDGIVGEGIETVSTKFVRPCPPLVEGVENCKVGDVVEVFHECAWKIAIILNVLEGRREVRSRRKALATRNRCLVGLLGSSREVNVDGSSMRMRQTWDNGKWILIGKGSTKNFYQKIPELSAGPKKQPQNHGVNNKEKSEFRDSRMISSRSLKRTSPYASSVIEAGNGQVRKLRAIVKDGQNKSKKVNAVNDYPREILGDKNVHTVREEPLDVLGNSKVKNSESNSDSNDCSVGSCSASHPSPDNIYIPFIPLVQKQSDNLCSDAESCIGSIPKKKSSSEEVEVKIRWLELHAYRRTLEALYASGPLSWDQQAMLTNLRIVLHISNDQHLMELKQLVSTRTATKC